MSANVLPYLPVVFGVQGPCRFLWELPNCNPSLFYDKGHDRALGRLSTNCSSSAALLDLCDCSHSRARSVVIKGLSPSPFGVPRLWSAKSVQRVVQPALEPERSALLSPDLEFVSLNPAPSARARERPAPCVLLGPRAHTKARFIAEYRHRAGGNTLTRSLPTIGNFSSLKMAAIIFLLLCVSLCLVTPVLLILWRWHSTPSLAWHWLSTRLLFHIFSPYLWVWVCFFLALPCAVGVE